MDSTESQTLFEGNGSELSSPPDQTTTTALDDGDFGDFQTFADSSEATTTTTSSSSSDDISAGGQDTKSSVSSNSVSNSSTPSHHPVIATTTSNNATNIPKYPNIYDLDMFAFQEFVTNFEEQLLEMFTHHSNAEFATTLPKSSSLSMFTTSDSQSFFNPDFSFPSANNMMMNNHHNLMMGDGPTSPIHSQEDIINDCPIWYNLTGSYNCKPPLQFQKSASFDHFVHSLNPSASADMNQPKAIQRKKIKPRMNTRILDLPANMKSRLTLMSDQDLNELNDSFEELEIGDSDDENLMMNRSGGGVGRVGSANGEMSVIEDELMANDLDMHSLIIGQELNGAGGVGALTASNRKDPMVVSADEVIEEIETIMESNGSNGSSGEENGMKSMNGSFPKQHNQNPIVSLNASSLLDAAMNSWQMYEQYCEEDEYDDEDDGAEGFRSLPANLNSQLLEEEENAAQGHNKPKASTKTAQNGLLIGSRPKSTSNHNPTFVEKLSRLSIAQLNELYMELEQIIQMRSEILIQGLALRDELEFEKELKNSFISLLLSVQNKRRYYMSGSGRPRLTKPSKPTSNKAQLARRNSTAESSASGALTSRLMSKARIDLSSLGSSLRESFRLGGSSSSGPSNPVYLTTVIPYQMSMNPLDVPTLQMLIKLLNALNEDSNTVPALLTEYILKVICP